MTSVVQALITAWISRFGVPQIIITDRGAQFEFQTWSQLLDRLGIKQENNSVPSIVQWNDARSHRLLKNALRAKEGTKWFWELPLVLLGIRSTVGLHGYSPSQYTYGTSLCLPSEFFLPLLQTENSETFAEQLFSKVENFRPPVRQYNTRSHIPKGLATAKYVWIREEHPKSSLHPRYLVPYAVLENDGKALKLQLGSRVTKVSAERVKPAFFPTEMDISMDSSEQ